MQVIQETELDEYDVPIITGHIQEDTFRVEFTFRGEDIEVFDFEDENESHLFENGKIARPDKNINWQYVAQTSQGPKTLDEIYDYIVSQINFDQEFCDDSWTASLELTGRV